MGVCQAQTHWEIRRKYSFREWPGVKISTNYWNYFKSCNLILFKEKPSENYRIRYLGSKLSTAYIDISKTFCN